MIDTPASPAPELIDGPNVLIMGPAGTGKTYSIGTLADAGIEVFYIDLENGLESLLAYWSDRNQPIPANVHWAKISSPAAGFKEMLAASKSILTLPFDSITKMQDPNRSKYDRFIKLLTILDNFIDERTGESFGSVDSWGPNRALVIDGLTGVCESAMQMVVGGKPVKSQPDWGVAQDVAIRLLAKLTDNCACWFVLIGHVEREVDQVLGGVKLMVSSLGKALTPKIPAKFSDVILSTRNGNKWAFDTASGQADLKTRNLPVQADLPPSFAPIVAKWKARCASASTKA